MNLRIPPEIIQVDNLIKFKIPNDLDGFIFTINMRTFEVTWINHVGKLQKTIYKYDDNVQSFFEKGSWIKI